jgi:predicted transcriptional regulator
VCIKYYTTNWYKLLLIQGNADGGSYVLRLEYLNNTISQKLTENIIENRFGVKSSRIFRILKSKNYLEQKQIAQIALLEIQEARKLLYLLMAGEMVHIQEVSKSSDKHPSKTFYLWGVDPNRVNSKLLDDMYKTVHNLRTRIEEEKKLYIEKSIFYFLFIGLVSDVEDLEKFGKIESRLQVSMIKLMNLVLYFEK